MAYLTGSRALELVGSISKPASDYDIVVSRDELAFLANSLKGTDHVLGKHQTYPGKYYLLTDEFVGDLTVSGYQSHNLINENLDSFCDRTISILGLDVHVISLTTCWIYKRGPATYPIHKKKTLGDLIDISAQVFGVGRSADYTLLNDHQHELLEILKTETKNKVSPEDRYRPEPDDVEEFFDLSVEDRIETVRRIAPDFDTLHILLGDLTGTRTANFILDNIGPISV